MFPNPSSWHTEKLFVCYEEVMVEARGACDDLQNCFGSFSALHLHINFKINLSIAITKKKGILVEIQLNLQVSLETK